MYLLCLINKDDDDDETGKKFHHKGVDVGGGLNEQWGGVVKMTD